MTVKLNELKKAVKEYQDANKGGWYSPNYGKLMYDKSDGQIWTDYFYQLGQNTWNVYHSSEIINLGSLLSEMGISVTIPHVIKFLKSEFLVNIQ